ncbi:MAG: DUF4340 domain-containing protein [Planctomycetes bacterium]|nr:DUF4340 domain-containing protein [Planctomycetota bacterium]
MSNRNLTILAVAAAVMLIWAVVQLRLVQQKMGQASTKGILIQGLATDDIGAIVLGAGADEVTLQKQNQSFVITNKDNYPAQFKSINELIKNCLEVQTTDLITQSADNHADLGVSEEKAKYLIKFLNAEKEVITGLVIGSSDESMTETYIRLIDSDDVYLADRSPYLSTGAMDFMDQNILSVLQDSIRQVQVFTGLQGYTLARDPNDTIVAAVISGMTVPKLDQSAAQQVFTALTSLSIDNVQSITTDDTLDFNVTYGCRLADSTAYTLDVAQKDGKYYIRCRASFSAQSPVKTPADTEEAYKQKVAEVLSAQEAAQRFTAKHNGWVYEIAAWKGDNLIKSLDELTEK